MSKSFLKPETRRWLLLGVAFVIVVVNYLDRQIISILKPVIKTQFALNDSGYAFIVNIFTVCYAITYPVAGWLVDRFGVRLVMFLGVISWAFATLGGGFSRTVGQFGFFRGVLGLAEPTSFPASVKLTTIWFPGRLRATANSLCQTGGSIGAILAPPAVAWLTIHYGWKSVFLVVGSLALLIAAVWFFLYRDPPEYIQVDSMTVTQVIDDRHFTWFELWKTRSLWGILLIRFISDPVWYFCLFWLPGYLQERAGLTLKQIGMLGWIPFLLADLGAIMASLLSDRLVRSSESPLAARKKTLTAIACLSPICVLIPYFAHATGALIIFSIVAVAGLSWLLTMNVVIAETFPINNVASVVGIAGGCGALGAVLFNIFVGVFIGTVGAGKIFWAMALLHPIALFLLWTVVRKERVRTIYGEL